MPSARVWVFRDETTGVTKIQAEFQFPAATLTMVAVPQVDPSQVLLSLTSATGALAPCQAAELTADTGPIVLTPAVGAGGEAGREVRFWLGAGILAALQNTTILRGRFCDVSWIFYDDQLDRLREFIQQFQALTAAPPPTSPPMPTPADSPDDAAPAPQGM